MRFTAWLTVLTCWHAAAAQLVINEIMVAPPGGIVTNSIHTTCPANSGATQAAEWVEIFNLGNGGCDTVDLSCYILASHMGLENGLCASGIGGDNAGAFIFPPGTLIPPYGFITVGGNNGSHQPTFNLADYRDTPYFCSSRRWFLNNSNGWIGLFNPQGVPVDAVYWVDSPGGADNIHTDYRFQSSYSIECNCSGQTITLPSAREIFLAGQMEYAGHTGTDFYFQTNGKFYRTPDGGTWNRLGPPPSPGGCNGTCLTQADLATVHPPSHTICPGQSVTFTAQPNIPGFIQYTWRSIPPGFSATGPSITVSPGQNHTYIMQAQRGACSGPRQADTVRVFMHSGFSPVFSAPTSVCIGSPATVVYTGDAQASANFVWNFGGGTAVPGTGPGPHAVTWNTPGPKTVSLRVVANGCTSSVESRTVQVFSVVPVTLSGSASHACTGQAFTVTANGSFPAGSVFEWNFGGGTATPGVGQGPHQVIWNTPGNKTVTLNVSSNACPTPPATLNIPVRSTPDAVFTVVPETLCSGQTAIVQYTGNILTGASYIWDFGDGQLTVPPNGVGPHTVLWNAPGVRTITLRVALAGCTSTVASRILTILGTPPSAFTVSQETLCTGQSVTVARIEPPSPGSELTWDFDGGTAVPGTGPGPHVVSWSTPGIKTIRHLCVTAGCSSVVFQRQVTVIQTPVAQFTLAPTACTGRAVELAFTGQAPPGAHYVWNFHGAAATPGVGAGPHTLVWDTPGLKTVMLTVVAGACSSQTFSFNVNVALTPSSLFGVSGATICQSDEVVATLNAPMPGANYVWDFDGGTALSGTGPGPHVVRWSSPGAKIISLYAFAAGCTSQTHTATVTVRAVPTAAFSASATTVCAGENVQLTFTGNAPPGAVFSWDFDGGMASPGPGGSHHVVWNAPGAKTVRLFVVLDACTSNVATQNILVRPIPTADFSVLPSSPCTGQNVSLTYTGTGTHVFWYVGDGEIVHISGFDREVRWNVPGVKTVTAYAVENGCTSAVATRTINVSPTPVAAFDVPTYACTNLPTNVVFTGAGTGTFVWDFGGGTAVPGVGAGPHSVTWDVPGTKTVSLRVVAGGCTSAVFERTLEVRWRPTIQLGTPNPVLCTGEQANVVYSGTGPAGTNYAWNFDGGTAAPGHGPQNQFVVWSSPGFKNVSLTAFANGCTAVATLGLNVLLTPTAEFSLSRNALCVGENLDVFFSGIPGNVYLWDFDGGVAVPGTGPGPHAVRWNAPGTKTVRLYVVAGSCTSSVVERNVVVYPVPTADFSVGATQICAGEATTLTYTGNAGPSAQFLWDFDGGTAVPGTGRGPHTIAWTQAGTKAVRLRVVENACTSQTVGFWVRVDAYPVAAFALAPEVCAGETLTVQFTGFLPPGTSVEWDAADANVVSLDPLRLVYSQPGDYSVSLTLNNAGCVDGPVTQTVWVKPVPTAAFSVFPAAVCAGRPATFSFDGDAGTQAILHWDLDGEIWVSAPSFQPVRVWESEGEKIVTLWAEENGCTSLLFRDTVRVFERLAQAFPPSALICLGDSITLTAQIPPVPGMEYYWTRADSIISHLAAITVAPQENAEYVLFSKLNDDCEYYDTVRVRVNDVRPESGFVFDKPWVCTGEGMALTFTGFAPEGSVYVWDLGAGGRYEPLGPESWWATWSASGLTPVSLYVVYDGCTSLTYTDTVEVRLTPVARFEGPTSVCWRDTAKFVFSGVAGPNAVYEWDYGGGDSLGLGMTRWNQTGPKRVRLRVRDHGCVSDVWVHDLAVQPIPTAVISLAETAACVGAPYRLSGSVSPFDAEAKYFWSWDGGEWAGGTEADPWVVWADSGMKTVRLRVERRGCISGEVSATIRVRPIPQSAFYCASALCVGDSLDVYYNGNSGPNAVYEWDFDGGTAIPGFGRGPHKVKWNGDGIRTLRLRVVENGCASETAERTVKVGMPDARFAAPYSACLDSFVVVRYAGTASGSGTWYVWNFDGGYAEPGVGPGPHRVRWTNPGVKTLSLQVVQQSCSSEVQRHTLAVRQMPVIVLEKSYQYDRAPTTVEYRIRGGEGNLTYYWDFGDGETESVLPHAEKTYFVSGKYPVRVRAVNEAGCETWDEDTMWVRPTAPGIPSAFTPNGDGLNDVFKIENLTSYLSVRLVVYGRWGLPVFESNRPDVFWDGNNPHGVPLPDGVYVYKFTAVETNGDVIEMSGTITLMR